MQTVSLTRVESHLLGSGTGEKQFEVWIEVDSALGP